MKYKPIIVNMIWKTTIPYLNAVFLQDDRKTRSVSPSLRVLTPFFLFVSFFAFLQPERAIAQNGSLEVICPAVNGEDEKQVFSTGPFNCTATLIPLAPEVTGDCQGWDWTFEVFREVTDPVTGEKKEELVAVAQNRVAAGIAPGAYFLRYIVIDGCNARRETDCNILVTDDISPVAACPSLTAVTLDELTTDDRGLFLLSAVQMSAESSDNCSEGLRREIRRTFDAACLGGYFDQVHGLTWPDDLVARTDQADQMTYYLAGNDTLLVETAGQYYSWWSDKAYFGCCDAGKKIFVDLVLTDRAGNRSACRSEVAVTDQLPPVATVDDVEILCTGLDFDPSDPGQVAGKFGSPEEVVEIREPCGVSIAEEISWTPADCGGGLLERRFTLEGNDGLTAIVRQNIEVIPVTNYEIEFPGDESDLDCSLGQGAEVRISDFGCNLITVVKDTIPMEASGGACERFGINYRVINWCEYSGDEDSGAIIVGRDADQDADYTEPTWVEVDYNDMQGRVVRFFTLDDQGGRLQTGEWNMEQYRGQTPGIFEYTQIVKIFDNQPPQSIVVNSSLEFCAFSLPQSGEACSGEFTVLLTATDDCSPDKVEIRNMEVLLFRDPNQAQGEGTGTFTLERSGQDAVVIGQLPIGTHRLIWETADGCGNVKYEALDIAIVDCKRPIPICKASRIVDLQPVDLDGDGQFDQAGNSIFAADLILAAPDDCTGPLTFSVNRFGRQPDPSQKSLEFSCDDLTENVIRLEVHAWDGAGNNGVCESIIEVRDDPDICGSLLGDGAIMGAVMTESGVQMQQVEMNLSGRGSKVLLSREDGTYNFSGLDEGYDYTIQPWLDRDFLNGVSTFDLVLISKHILQLEALASPYRIIAADVNNSRTVTTLDLVQLRKVVLNIETKFRNNTSWRFVDARYEFPNPANPWQEAFPEVININDLEGDNIGNNFVAVKIGDVSGNAVAGLIAEAKPRDGKDAFYLQASDDRLERGVDLEVPIYAIDAGRLQGMQFTLELDPEKALLLGVKPGILKDDNIGLFQKEGLITASWNTYESDPDCEQNLSGGAERCPVLVVVIRPLQHGRLQDVLSISSSRTAAEAYDLAGNTVDLFLKMDPAADRMAGLILEQNFPNPFRDRTSVRFSLPGSGAATLTVWDAQGRLLHLQTGQFEAGDHVIELDRGMFSAEGLLIYRLESAYGQASRKMLLSPD